MADQLPASPSLQGSSKGGAGELRGRWSEAGSEPGDTLSLCSPGERCLTLNVLHTGLGSPRSSGGRRLESGRPEILCLGLLGRVRAPIAGDLRGQIGGRGWAGWPASESVAAVGCCAGPLELGPVRSVADMGPGPGAWCPPFTAVVGATNWNV
ncbi:hypothetical protein NDU88_004479 [Pleurodeles waltl]|uniref:Uncharacterized protein n=1 Tax=Pleurodeles waltl TaxID=8319 RepID=A0AAV7MBU2_PLEWA|nr:hypothetical protein NDU88_004479 [Pleurodeles waltl]